MSASAWPMKAGDYIIMSVGVNGQTFHLHYTEIIKMKLISKNNIITIFIFLVIFQGNACSKTVTLPLSIDYQLLKSLVIKSAYTDENQTKLLINENMSCLKITISEPNFKVKDTTLLFETRVSIRAGVYIMEKCRMPVEWDGYIVFTQRPVIDDKWSLSFDTIDSNLYDIERKPARLAGIAWGFVKADIYDYLENIYIDIAPPLFDLKSFLNLLFSPDVQPGVTNMLKSMRPGDVLTTPEALQIGILTNVEIPEAKEEDEEIQKRPVLEEEIKEFVNLWEIWDAFLVHVITSLFNEPLSEEEKIIILSAELETRHRFVEELIKGSSEKDFVRDQFISVWNQLSPIFRSHLSDNQNQSLLSYLGFFNAIDALSVLDKLGPTLGIEISRNGLIRLARLLATGEPVNLVYQYGVNEKLRNVLGFGPLPETTSPSFDGEELEIEIQNTSSFLPLSQISVGLLKAGIWGWISSRSQVHAADNSSITIDEIKKWMVTKYNFDGYLKDVKDLIIKKSASNLEKSDIDEKYHKLYDIIVLATGWQESCYRQFIIDRKKRKITYLRSYNGTSVGLMQINERVWRGLYDRHHLRWNIEYNVIAGCEILELYLRKYTLKRLDKMKTETQVDDDTLAQLVYSMYNGGPSQFHEFLKRKKSGKLYTSDKLFLEKYTWVKTGQFQNVSKCLIGE